MNNLMQKLTPQQYNEQRLMQRAEAERLSERAPVVCPKCNGEMIFPCPNTALPTDPPQRNVKCLACGHRDTIVC